jgi:hypothetical protein
MWSPLITMTVICTPTSTVLTETGYPNTLTDVQYVQANDADAALLTRFTLPIVTSSESACPVLSVRAVVSNSLIAPASSEFVAPSGLANLIPSSLSTEKDYSLYLVYTALGGAEMISSLKKLIVGCTSSIVQTVASTFAAGKTVNMEVDSLSTDLYTFPLPSLDRAYCSVTTSGITNA